MSPKGLTGKYFSQCSKQEFTPTMQPRDTGEYRNPKTRDLLLVLGLSRTGGTSLSRALGALGYENLYDLDDIANGGPEHARFWLNAAQRKLSGKSGFSLEEVDGVLDGYDGVRNVPSAAFAAEFIRHYPSSRVILPTRDVDGWHAVLSILHYTSLLSSTQTPASTTPMSQGREEGRGRVQQQCKAAYREHVEYIRQNVPSELLLEYSVEQGWEPLCKFLDKEKPAEEFPRSNGRDVFWKGCRKRDMNVIKQLAVNALFIVAGASALAAGWSYREAISGYVT
ncbi:hypothetical protein MGYG_02693 [Nannizzia gypsea CBS 118893]|uniref:NAD dependent epimerase/dehydratase n=1 Tax=Arthroderma gypseum (strain ATCC MYA-4604 / CBS 118893) TaxID=535722 RepID=E4UNS7_ARTGP|nr:hypothetical protein MGYG_02693 [Nannizzia gypsea CBS 118893]EFQ99680.1 hypothetical protein MGYG_02693 [Nannizzia gypsea CBS 118893]